MYYPKKTFSGLEPVKSAGIKPAVMGIGRGLENRLAAIRYEKFLMRHVGKPWYDSTVEEACTGKDIFRMA